MMLPSKTVGVVAKQLNDTYVDGARTDGRISHEIFIWECTVRTLIKLFMSGVTTTRSKSKWL